MFVPFTYQMKKDTVGIAAINTRKLNVLPSRDEYIFDSQKYLEQSKEKFRTAGGFRVSAVEMTVLAITEVLARDGVM